MDVQPSQFSRVPQRGSHVGSQSFDMEFQVFQSRQLPQPDDTRFVDRAVHVDTDDPPAKTVGHDEFQPLRAGTVDRDASIVLLQIGDNRILQIRALAGRGKPGAKRGHQRHRGQHRSQAPTQARPIAAQQPFTAAGGHGQQNDPAAPLQLIMHVPLWRHDVTALHKLASYVIRGVIAAADGAPPMLLGLSSGEL